MLSQQLRTQAETQQQILIMTHVPRLYVSSKRNRFVSSSLFFFARCTQVNGLKKDPLFLPDQASGSQPDQASGSQLGAVPAGTAVDHSRIQTTPFSGANNKEWTWFHVAVPVELLSPWAAASTNPYSQESQRKIANAIAAGANAIAEGVRAISAEDPNVPRDSAGPPQVAGGSNCRNPDGRPPDGSTTQGGACDNRHKAQQQAADALPPTGG